MADSHFDDLTRRNALKTLGGAGAVAVAGCTDSGGGNIIRISGSSTVYPLMFAIAEQYQQDNDVDPELSEDGSGGGFSDFFCNGDSDFNNASRQIKEEERQLCEDNGVEPVELTVATDALTVVVNNDNDFVDSLTIEELASIWEENPVETWNEVRD